MASEEAKPADRDKKKKKQKQQPQAAAEPSPLDVEEGLDGVGIRVDKPKVKHLGGGLTIKDLCIGSGQPPSRGKHVRILYEGRLVDGTTFDSNQNRRRPLTFRLGLREVVAGMDKGLEGMRVGGIREIKIPPAMGYGNRKTGPIPANSELHFTVELIGIGQKAA
jgi:FK506-binding nuclear protein